MLGWLPDVPYLEAHPHWWWLFTVFVIGVAYIHSHDASTNRPNRWWMALFALCGLAVVVLVAIDTSHKVTFEMMIAMTCVFGSGLYACLADLLRFGWAAQLTRTRGEKWIKEMDYPYLLLGAGGLMLSINKLDVVSDRITRIDVIGPLVVSTAVVIRLLKTRADIEGWNKLSSD